MILNVEIRKHSVSGSERALAIETPLAPRDVATSATRATPQECTRHPPVAYSTFPFKGASNVYTLARGPRRRKAKARTLFFASGSRAVSDLDHFLVRAERVTALFLLFPPSEFLTRELAEGPRPWRSRATLLSLRCDVRGGICAGSSLKRPSVFAQLAPMSKNHVGIRRRTSRRSLVLRAPTPATPNDDQNFCDRTDKRAARRRRSYRKRRALVIC